jgi:hypothetical protein
LKAIRQVSDVPVIMLTARGEDIDPVRGLAIQPASNAIGTRLSSEVNRAARHLARVLSALNPQKSCD